MAVDVSREYAVATVVGRAISMMGPACAMAIGQSM